jgi:hypothetical protein
MGGSTRRNEFVAMDEGQPVSVPFMPAIGIDLGPFAVEAQISAEMQGRSSARLPVITIYSGNS